MRKVIGIGETILDIVFIDHRPQTATPGGSVYNGILSLARMGCPVSFISETGNDHVGKLILDHMKTNGVDTQSVNVFPEGKSPVSLAFINQAGDAEYIFYKDYPRQRLEVNLPDIQADDILMMGSYFAINPVLRPKVKEIVEHAKSRGALVYYDVNYRSTHANEAMKLMPSLIENFEYADIVRGSLEDFQYIFGQKTAEQIYAHHISFYCPRFICTNGGKPVELFTPTLRQSYTPAAIEPLSTVGAGDNFNAGVVYALLKQHLRKSDLDELTSEDWNRLIRCGMSFSTDVCRQYENAVSDAFVRNFKL